MSVSNQKVTFTSVCCMLVAQLAHTCMFDNSHGQLNGAYKLLMGVSRERVTFAREWYCSQDVPTWSKSCACGQELSAELIVFSCSLKVVTSFFLAIIEVLRLCTASSP